jgi:hypothetical protein
MHDRLMTLGMAHAHDIASGQRFAIGRVGT